MEVNFVTNKIKNNSYLPIGWSDKKKKKKLYKINFLLTQFVKMTTNRKQTYIFFALTLWDQKTTKK